MFATTFALSTLAVAEEYTPPIPEPVPVVITGTSSQPVEPDEKPVEQLSYAVACNCYAYQKEKYFPNLPNTATIKSNLKQEIGDIAVFYYPNSGLYHYAKVTRFEGNSFWIDEANYRRCQITQRKLNTQYPRLIGFYDV